MTIDNDDLLNSIMASLGRIETISLERFLALFHAKYLEEARLSGKVKEFIDL